MTVKKHPAQFTDVIVETFRDILDVELGHSLEPREYLVLDPFAGVGNIHQLNGYRACVETIGVELEPDWASAHPRTIIGDACKLPFHDDYFDAIMTSPCYGNRMADHHNAKDGSRRITYQHYYGKPLHSNNAGLLQWGSSYMLFHQRAWEESLRVLKPGGLFVVNISNHIRKGEVQPVVEWHLRTLMDLGLFVEFVDRVRTPRMRMGANAHARVEYEHILVVRNGG